MKEVSESLGKYHPEVGEWANAMGLIYKQQGRFAHALTNLATSLLVSRMVYSCCPTGRDKTIATHNIAIAHHNMSGVYYSQDNLAESLKAVKNALAIHRILHGENSMKVAACLSTIADVYERRGHHAKALAKYERAIAIARVTASGHSSSESKKLVKMLANTAEILCDIGRKEDACKYRLEALYMLRNLHVTEGDDFVSQITAAMLLNSARCGQVLHPGTLEKTQLAISLLQKAHGNKSPQTATGLFHLATLYEARGKLKDALKLHKRVLKYRQRSLGFAHEDIGDSIREIASVKLQLDKNEHK
jgi:tetratricopeptide (TPR) repeat protein